ncbi:hypothetical protein U9M48_035483 [Paspalum notatum var. saurae]|uniref:Uncharacterized protein n=1 Tax=Paspalum notatum var. saurae TaxID=547442 RepID=A0AAQ3X927_PASNO
MASPPLAPSPSAPPLLPASSPCHGAATAPPPHLLEELANWTSSLHCLLQAPATTGSAPGPPSFAVARSLLADFAERRLWLHLDIKQRQPLQIDARALLSTAARHQRRLSSSVRQISPSTSSSMSPKVSLHFQSPFHSIVCCVPSCDEDDAYEDGALLQSEPCSGTLDTVLLVTGIPYLLPCTSCNEAALHNRKSEGDALRHGVVSSQHQLDPASYHALPQALDSGRALEGTRL